MIWSHCKPQSVSRASVEYVQPSRFPNRHSEHQRGMIGFFGVFCKDLVGAEVFAMTVENDAEQVGRILPVPYRFVAMLELLIHEFLAIHNTCDRTETGLHGP